MEDERLQRSIAYRVGCGLALVPVGFGLTTVMTGMGAMQIIGQRDATFMEAAAAPLAISALGALIAGWGLVDGVRRVARRNEKSPRERVDGALIVNFEVTDRKNNPVYDPTMYDPDELRYYVRLEIPGRGVKEFKTTPAVLAGAGEGMRGTAEIQGDWLGKFEPAAPAEEAHRPWL